MFQEKNLAAALGFGFGKNDREIVDAANESGGNSSFFLNYRITP